MQDIFLLPAQKPPCFWENHTGVRRTQVQELCRLSWNFGCPLTSYMTLGQLFKLAVPGVSSVKWSHGICIFERIKLAVI